MNLETLHLGANGLAGWKGADGLTIREAIEARVWAHIAKERQAQGLSTVQAEIERKRLEKIAALRREAAELKKQGQALLRKAAELKEQADLMSRR